MGRMSHTKEATTVEEHRAVGTVRSAADVRRQWKMVALFAVVALLLVWFLVDIKDPSVNYLVDNAVGEKPHSLNADVVVVIGLVIAVLATALAALNRIPAGGWTVVASLLVGASFLLGFLVWN